MTFLMMLVSTLIVAILVMRASGTQPYGDSIFDHEDNDDLGFLADQGTEEDLQRNDPLIRQWKWPVRPWTTIKLPIKRTTTTRTTTKKPKVVSTTQSPQILGCGTNNSTGKVNQNKIVGGHKVAPKWKFPWMVAIIAWERDEDRWKHQCGGFNPKWPLNSLATEVSLYLQNCIFTVYEFCCHKIMQPMLYQRFNKRK